MDLILLGLAVALILAALYRYRAGFGLLGKTISRDNVTLRDPTTGLIGRPDRLVRRGRHWIAEDRKSSTRVYESTRIQLGAYMLLIEHEHGVRPPYAVAVTGDGRRHKVKNTRALRKQVLSLLAQVRQVRADVHSSVSGTPSFGKCQSCGQRRHCEQAAA